ncbi:MAG TPA: dolichyl-phosphate beta-glucosyltransferase [Thermoanaerobaculia bacterium]|nr:dolichyl-phosphate beta-glucosyltransferase [Thermoanaerobaculia bacterium]
MNENRIELSVVVPAYNEERRLAPGLRQALEYLARRGEPYELLVVDDGSRDETVRVAESFAPQGVRVVRHERNRGKGAAVRTGLLASRGRKVLISDADFSTPIEEVEKLERFLQDGTPLVIGSRGLADSQIRQRQPFYREMMGRTFNRLIRLFGVSGIRDTQCGFKLARGEEGRRIAAELKIEGFAWDVEMIWLARRRGYGIAEVGVVWVNSPDSRVDPIRSSFSMLRDVITMRLRHRGER